MCLNMCLNKNIEWLKPEFFLRHPREHFVMVSTRLTLRLLTVFTPTLMQLDFQLIMFVNTTYP